MLATRLPFAVEKWQLLLWDLYILLSLLLVVLYSLRTFPSSGAKLLSVGVVFVTSLFVTKYVSSVALILFVLFCFTLFYYLRFGAVWALVLAGVNALLAFYLKANVGLPALAMLGVALGIAWLGWTATSRRTVVVFLALFLVALFVLAKALRVDLPGYVVGQVHLASAYNDAMAIPVDRNALGVQHLTMAVTLLVAFVLVGLFSLRYLAQEPILALMFAMTGVHLYLLFKNGFLRPDEHVRLFFLDRSCCARCGCAVDATSA